MVPARGGSFDCDWDPFGTGSWGGASSLQDLRADTDVIVKAKVTGHGETRDTFPGGTRPFQMSYLVNDLEVLDVIKGHVPSGRILASSGGGVCLKSGDTYYLFLKEPQEGYSEQFQDDPNKPESPPVYYIVHPFGQWRVRDGRIEHLPDWFPAEPLPKQYHGMPEAAFVEQVRQAMQDTSGS